MIMTYLLRYLAYSFVLSQALGRSYCAKSDLLAHSASTSGTPWDVGSRSSTSHHLKQIVPTTVASFPLAVR